MPRVVNVREAKTHRSRLLEAVRQGEEIILALAARDTPEGGHVIIEKGATPRVA